MNCIRTFFVITLIICLTAVNLEAEELIARARFPKDGATETKLVIGRYIRIPVRIVYKGRVFKTLFALDTGAAHTVVSQDLAKQMGVEGTRHAGHGYLSDLKASAAAFKVSSIKVGPIERKDHQVYVLQSDQKGWSKLKGMNILGMDLLKDAPFSIDLQAGVIRWGNDWDHNAEIEVKTTAIIKDARVFLPVNIVYKGQRFSKLFLLDTGAPQTTVTPSFAKMLGITNARQGRRIKISSIEAGPLQLKDYYIGIWNTPDNLIGMDLLKYIPFTIDYEAGVVKWNLAL